MTAKSKKLRTPTIHKKEIFINKDKLKMILDSRGLEYIEFHDKLTRRDSEYGLDLTYKGFMSLLSNRNTWKLLYAHAICDTLKVSYEDIFDLVDVDIEREKIIKKEWKEKYQR